MHTCPIPWFSPITHIMFSIFLNVLNFLLKFYYLFSHSVINIASFIYDAFPCKVYMGMCMCVLKKLTVNLSVWMFFNKIFDSRHVWKNVFLLYLNGYCTVHEIKCCLSCWLSSLKSLQHSLLTPRVTLMIIVFFLFWRLPVLSIW